MAKSELTLAIEKELYKKAYEKGDFACHEVTLGWDGDYHHITKFLPSQVGDVPYVKKPWQNVFETEEDGTIITLNDVEKALGNIGVELRNSEGLFRNMSEVLDEVASKWKNLDNVD